MWSVNYEEGHLQQTAVVSQLAYRSKNLGEERVLMQPPKPKGYKAETQLSVQAHTARTVKYSNAFFDPRSVFLFLSFHRLIMSVLCRETQITVSPFDTSLWQNSDTSAQSHRRNFQKSVGNDEMDSLKTAFKSQSQAIGSVEREMGHRLSEECREQGQPSEGEASLVNACSINSQ